MGEIDWKYHGKQNLCQNDLPKAPNVSLFLTLKNVFLCFGCQPLFSLLLTVVWSWVKRSVVSEKHPDKPSAWCFVDLASEWEQKSGHVSLLQTKDWHDSAGKLSLCLQLKELFKEISYLCLWRNSYFDGSGAENSGRFFYLRSGPAVCLQILRYGLVRPSYFSSSFFLFPSRAAQDSVFSWL